MLHVLEKKSTNKKIAIDYFLNFILFKLNVSEREAANKKITDLETEVKTLKRKVETLPEEKMKQYSGNNKKINSLSLLKMSCC